MGGRGADWLTWRKKPPREQDEGDSACAGSQPTAGGVWTPGVSVSCLSWGGSPLRPYRGPSLSEQGWEGKPLEGGIYLRKFGG